MHDFKLTKETEGMNMINSEMDFIISQQEEIDVQVLNFIVNAEGKKMNLKRKRKKKKSGKCRILDGDKE